MLRRERERERERERDVCGTHTPMCVRACGNFERKVRVCVCIAQIEASDLAKKARAQEQMQNELRK